jgi:hypothetical protein
MTKVKMIKSTYGVNDGQVYPTLFVEGEEYEIGARLLECFIEMGVVDLQSAAEEEYETKVVKPAETKPAKKPAKK